MGDKVIPNASVEQIPSGNILSEQLIEEYIKYKKYTILMEYINECLETSPEQLGSETEQKIQKILSEKQFSQIKLPANNEVETLDILGINLNEHIEQLTVSESQELQKLLGNKLDEKIDNHKKSVFLTEQDIEETATENSNYSIDLLNALKLEQDTYLNHMNELIKILECLKDVRLNTTSELVTDKINQSELQTRINYLQSQLAKEKCRMTTIGESYQSQAAYKIAIDDMKKQKIDLLLDIENLKKLKKKYEEVECEEYEDILQEYLKYMDILEKNKMMENLCDK